MIERIRPRLEAWLARHGFPVGLVLVLALILLLPIEARPPIGAVDDAPRVAALRETLDGLPAGAAVIVGFDPDIGTYPEIRHPTRALLADLLGRGVELSLVSLTPEGRALAIEEHQRLLRAGVPAQQLTDLGYLPGAEAALVRSVSAIGPALDDAPAGLERFDLAVVVGGIDLHARTWVEQVGPRLPGLPIVAVAPGYLQPELAPYLDSGQLAGLLATVADGAAYAELAPDPGRDSRPVHAPALAVGMLILAGVLLHASMGSIVGPAGRVLRRWRA